MIYHKSIREFSLCRLFGVSLCSPCADFFSLSGILERILVRKILLEVLKHISFYSSFVCKRCQQRQRAQTRIGQKCCILQCASS